MERIAGLARLEEYIRILRRAANNRPVRTQCPLPRLNNELVVHQRANRLVADGKYLAHFMRSAETVKEMNERNARLERGHLRHQRHIGHFLHGIRSQHRPARRPASHHVRVIAKDRQRVRGQRPRRHMHRRRGQLAGNLEHVRNHQQQALRRRKRGRKCARLQCAVQRACRAALALQLFHHRQRAPDILLSLRAPLIGPLGHRRRGGNGVNGNYFRKTIGHRSGRFVPIQNHHLASRFLFTHSVSLIARPKGDQPLR